MLIHGVSIMDEIQDFNQRLSAAREMFSVSSIGFIMNDDATTHLRYYRMSIRRKE
jgi:uncharacterized protein YjfI (DUF2170 family)